MRGVGAPWPARYMRVENTARAALAYGLQNRQYVINQLYLFVIMYQSNSAHQY